MIYLDSNATTGMLPEVLEAMLPWYQTHYGNPSGVHREAKLAKQAIAEAREQVALLIGAQPDEIVITSGGTESVNTALHSLDQLTGEGLAVISAIEHSSVLRWTEKQQRKTHWLPVNRLGVCDVSGLSQIQEKVAYLSVMTANNETGVIQPMDQIVSDARILGVPIHTDAIQAVGKMRVDVGAMGVDMLSLSAHKFHGPKGIGALYVRSGLKFEPLLLGGGQEQGRRSGTENTAAIVGMGVAAKIAREWLETNGEREVAQYRDQFENLVREQITEVTINGDLDRRLSNTSHLSFDGCEAAGLLILLDDLGVACSAGSSCMSGKQAPSHVQMAMGLSEKQAKSSLRFSLSRLNTQAEVVQAVKLLKRAVDKLRSIQGSGVGPVTLYT